MRTEGAAVSGVGNAPRTPAVANTAAGGPGSARVSLRAASLSRGTRTLWQELSLDVAAGEFVAILGPNGAGKSTLLQVLLGQTALSAGSVALGGRTAPRGGHPVGYIPQQAALGGAVPLRGKDVVAFGLDGHRLGPRLRHRHARRRAVAAALQQAGAGDYAEAPVGELSGGERQRLRVAQALVADPDVLLCDEPLAGLDPAQQHRISSLIEARRQAANTAILFVTHELAPILPLVDRVLYLVDGRHRVGTVEEIMTSQTLSTLYHADIEVLRVRDRLVVLGTDQPPAGQHPEPPAPGPPPAGSAMVGGW